MNVQTTKQRQYGTQLGMTDFDNVNIASTLPQ